MANWKTDKEAIQVNCPHLGKCTGSMCGFWSERDCPVCKGKGTAGKRYEGEETVTRHCPVCKGTGSDGTGYGRCGNSKG